MSWLERGEGGRPEHKVHEKVTEEVDCNNLSLQKDSLVFLWLIWTVTQPVKFMDVVKYMKKAAESLR